MLDFAKLRLKVTPNQWLVAPEGATPAATPHAPAPVFAVPADRLAALVDQIALAEPKTERVELSADGLRADYVQRSALMGFPDLVAVQAIPLGPKRSTLAIYSRARYGIRDFGVNRRRVERWLAEIARLAG